MLSTALAQGRNFSDRFPVGGVVRGPTLTQVAAVSVMWFRRDLRLADNPALWAAADQSAVVPLFVLDDRLRRPAGANRLAFLYRALRSLDHGLGGRLVVRAGDPAAIVPAVAAEAGAHRVVCAADFGPYGRRRDEAVAAALTAGGRGLERIGSPYAVAPGTVVKGDGQPYQVFTAYYRQWQSRLDPETAPPPRASWKTLPSDGVPKDPSIIAQLPEASEAAARSRLDRFLEEGVTEYRTRRERPADDGTSRLSPYLKFGLLHPDAVVSRLAAVGEPFPRQLAWRDFYADVLWHAPESARRSWSPRMRELRADHGSGADERFRAWAEGRTGYPLVDAGMRQLLAEGWMHNRVRMVTASFLVKDLHLPWERGARHFLAQLVDGDLASNNHGWQWVAGSGTDAAPFTRIFNPVAQSRRWDPDGAYLRRYLPELAGVRAPEVHEPWRRAGFPAPIVDHAEERLDALLRHREASARSGRGAR